MYIYLYNLRLIFNMSIIMDDINQNYFPFINNNYKLKVYYLLDHRELAKHY